MLSKQETRLPHRLPYAEPIKTLSIRIFLMVGVQMAQIYRIEAHSNAAINTHLLASTVHFTLHLG